MQGKLNATQVAVIVGSSVPTINMWYKWKKENPDHELAQLLPDFEQLGNRQARFWNQEDVYRLIQFKQSLPKGRNGILGKVTQKYVKK